MDALLARAMHGRTREQRPQKGFTLIELMIAVTIMAILVTIAYPSYVGQLRKTRRSEAKQMMVRYAQDLEKCFTVNLSYVRDLPPADGVADCSVPDTDVPTGADYDIAFASRTQNAFVMTGTRKAGSKQQPGAASTGDSHCQQFRIDNLGRRTATDSGGANADDCW